MYTRVTSTSAGRRPRSRRSPDRALHGMAVVLTALLLGACGGGGSSGGGSGSAGNGDASTAAAGATGAAGSSAALVTQPATKADAARFLSSASFGPRATDIDRVMAGGYDGWLAEQFATNPAQTHLTDYDVRKGANNNQDSADYVYNSFWKQAINGPDQLGQRVAFALSQIFVVSLVDGSVSQYPRGVASYYDTLRADAFGNFRQLLQDVTLHPMMGLYLTYLKNQGQAGRQPDENYAREVMQLFTIGLYQLDATGTPRRDAAGNPLPTYGNDDVTGLARVFTGWSWYGPDTTDTYFRGQGNVPDREITPMKAYESFHASDPKVFLGTTCPGGTQAAASLKCALDALFNHPNVGPFFGRQLIQRLVTSNPSPAYVARVAAAFADNGNGVRGDMKAVLRAVLLDAEARGTVDTTTTTTGKVREPLLRASAFLRAFDATSVTGDFRIGNTDDPGGSLGQTVMRSPSVFNFYRPGYVPPNSDLAAAGLVAPELQLTNETSVAGYLNTMQNAVQSGLGWAPGNQVDVKADYTDELALAGDPDALLDRVSLLLMSGQMTAATRQRIRDVLNTITLSQTNATAADSARRNRVRVAVFLSLASPEFLVQK